MKRLPSAVADSFQLEVVECDCGFHMGIDATYLDQVGDVQVLCPVCEQVWNTADVIPEDDPTTASTYDPVLQQIMMDNLQAAGYKPINGKGTDQ